MESYPSKMGLCAVAAFGLAMVATFSACGNENTTEVNESTGLDIIAKGDTLPQCGSDNAGEMVFVTDSSAVFYCADEKWSTLNGKDGEKGETGATGAQGEKGDKGDTGAEGKATNGTSCSAEKKADGSIEVSCGGEVVGTLTNGTDGKSAYELAKENDENVGVLADWLASLKGDAGKNCSIADVKDPNDATKVIGYEITCDKDKKVVSNGTDGKPGVGCTVTDEGDGVVKVACGDDENAEPVTLYKAMCGTESYDPEEKFCYELELYDLCGGKDYNLEKEYCLTLKNQNGETVSKIEALLIDDRDNQVYKTVTIGTQTWMAQNLNYAYTGVKFSYSDGSTTYESDSTSWCGGGTDEMDGDCSVYGRLYTFAAAIDSVALARADNPQTCGYGLKCGVSGRVQGVCPDGWHLPSRAEWETLSKAVDAEYTAGSNTVGEKLKASSSLWNTSYSEVTNEDSFGFAVLPAGYRNSEGGIYAVGKSAFFWSSTVPSFYDAYYWLFYYANPRVSNQFGQMLSGFSVRCLKDSN